MFAVGFTGVETNAAKEMGAYAKEAVTLHFSPELLLVATALIEPEVPGLLTTRASKLCVVADILWSLV